MLVVFSGILLLSAVGGAFADVVNAQPFSNGKFCLYDVKVTPHNTFLIAVLNQSEFIHLKVHPVKFHQHLLIFLSYISIFCYSYIDEN